MRSLRQRSGKRWCGLVLLGVLVPTLSLLSWPAPCRGQAVQTLWFEDFEGRAWEGSTTEEKRRH